MTEETLLKNSLTINNSIITLGDTVDSGKGRHFKSRFIQPGLAGYPGQFGNALIKKENLDKFVHTLRNKPVTINHKDNIGDDDKVGEVLNVWYNPEDGWYWCDGIITDETAINLINDKNWSVSCSYDFTKYDDEGGTENNIPYDIEFLDGEFNHLAIVDNPRYEGANIVFNSKVKNTFEGHKGREGFVGGSLPRGINSNLSKDIDQVIAGTFPERKMLNFGNPPDVLQDLGVPNKPMYMAQHKYLMSTERKDINGEIHHIADETMKDLPNLLKEPLLVMTSRRNSNRYVVAINAKDKNDKYIFVIIDYDWQGKRNNIIPSVYGKDEYFEYIKNAYLNNEIIYQHKNLKISGSQVQFPRCNQKVSNNIINVINTFFNPNRMENKNMNVQNWNEQDRPRDEQGKFTEKGNHTAKSYYEQEYQEALKEIAEGKDYAQINFNTNIGEMKSALAHLKRFDSDWDKYDVYENIKEYEDLSDDWNKEQIGRIAREKAAQETLKKWISEGKDRKNEYYKIYEPHKVKNNKERDMALLDELKKLITKVENDKGENMTDEKEKKDGEKIDNEKVDKRKLIDEVGGILKGKVDDEIIRTIIGKMEKASYDDSEASADNKKVKNEAEEEKADELKEKEKEDVENKCKNSVDNSKTDFFEKMNKIYNSAIEPTKAETEYVSRADRLKAGEEYFKV